MPDVNVVDVVLNNLKNYLNADDIVIDGGNSHFKDSIVRARDLEKMVVHLLDYGTSGGNRVKKTVFNPPLSSGEGAGVRSVTFYLSDAAGNTLAIYEQDLANNAPLTLTEVSVHAAGRIGVYKPAFATVYYEVSDHLGNVRGVVGKPMNIAVTATYENATLSVEQRQFLRYENARRISATLFDHTKTSGISYSQRLNGNANEKFGLSRAVAVLPGDVVSAEVFVKYGDPTPSNWLPGSILPTVLSQIASGGILDGAAFTTSTPSFPYGSLLTNRNNRTQPKAFLSWLVFDKNFQLLGSTGYAGVTDLAREYGQLGPHEKLTSPNITITEPGFVYFFISNENLTPVELFFDDLKVTQNMSNIVVGADYYPFGLPIAERELTREPYRYGYQGQYSEKDKETGLNFFDLRMYDARIGRWTTYDPYRQFNSTYVGMGNSPTNGVDVDGGLFGKWRAKQWANKNRGGFYFDKVTKTWWGEAQIKSGVWAKNFGSQGLGLSRLLRDGKSFHVKTEVSFGIQAGFEIDNIISLEGNLVSFPIIGNDKTLDNNVFTSFSHKYDTNKGEFSSDGLELRSPGFSAKVASEGYSSELTQFIKKRGQEYLSSNRQRHWTQHHGFIKRTGQKITSYEFNFSAKALIGVDLTISYK